MVSRWVVDHFDPEWQLLEMSNLRCPSGTAASSSTSAKVFNLDNWDGSAACNAAPPSSARRDGLTPAWGPRGMLRQHLGTRSAGVFHGATVLEESRPPPQRCLRMLPPSSINTRIAPVPESRCTQPWQTRSKSDNQSATPAHHARKTPCMGRIFTLR